MQVNLIFFWVTALHFGYAIATLTLRGKMCCREQWVERLDTTEQGDHDLDDCALLCLDQGYHLMIHQSTSSRCRCGLDSIVNEDSFCQLRYASGCSGEKTQVYILSCLRLPAERSGAAYQHLQENNGLIFTAEESICSGVLHTLLISINSPGYLYVDVYRKQAMDTGSYKLLTSTRIYTHVTNDRSNMNHQYYNLLEATSSPVYINRGDVVGVHTQAYNSGVQLKNENRETCSFSETLSSLIPGYLVTEDSTTCQDNFSVKDFAVIVSQDRKISPVKLSSDGEGIVNVYSKMNSGAGIEDRQWHIIDSEHWTAREALVVCERLSLISPGTASLAVDATLFSGVDSSELLPRVHVDCSRSEAACVETVSDSEISESEQAGVICQAEKTVSLHIDINPTATYSSHAGYVYLADRFYLASNALDDHVAQVICSSLGFSGFAAINPSDHIASNSQVVQGEWECHGNAEDLFSCNQTSLLTQVDGEAHVAYVECQLPDGICPPDGVYQYVMGSCHQIIPGDAQATCPQNAWLSTFTNSEEARQLDPECSGTCHYAVGVSEEEDGDIVWNNDRDPFTSNTLVTDTGFVVHDTLPSCLLARTTGFSHTLAQCTTQAGIVCEALPVCQVVAGPEVVSDATATYVSRGHIVRFTCADGYYNPVGNLEGGGYYYPQQGVDRECGSTGQWSGEQLVCQQIEGCLKETFPIHNAHITSHEGATYIVYARTEVTWECDPGYATSAAEDRELRCQGTNVWDDVDPSIHCIPIFCPLSGEMGSFQHPAYGCADIALCGELQASDSATLIDGSSHSFNTTIEMDQALNRCHFTVGKLSNDMLSTYYQSWLKGRFPWNVDLREGGDGSIDARNLALYFSTHTKLDADNGTSWSWPLPSSRNARTLWDPRDPTAVYVRDVDIERMHGDDSDTITCQQTDTGGHHVHDVYSYPATIGGANCPDVVSLALETGSVTVSLGTDIEHHSSQYTACNALYDNEGRSTYTYIHDTGDDRKYEVMYHKYLPDGPNDGTSQVAMAYNLTSTVTITIQPSTVRDSVTEDPYIEHHIELLSEEQVETLCGTSYSWGYYVDTNVFPTVSTGWDDVQVVVIEALNLDDHSTQFHIYEDLVQFWITYSNAQLTVGYTTENDQSIQVKI